MNAKFRYVQLVRSLKSYGITYFECQQRSKNKKKVERVFLGITRSKILKVHPSSSSDHSFGQPCQLSALKLSSILRVNSCHLTPSQVEPETMKVVKEWTWEQMRRWSSVRKTFTFDFGDYEDDYVNVLCEEAESLSALIAGYIELILRGMTLHLLIVSLQASSHLKPITSCSSQHCVVLT